MPDSSTPTSRYAVAIKTLLFSCLNALTLTTAHGDDLPLFNEQFDSLLTVPIEALMNRHVTVASRYDQRLSDAPATITVIGRQQIAKMGLDNLPELLARIPGIQVDYDSKTANRVPAFNVRGQYNAQVLILLDGEPINDQVNPKPMIFAHHLSLHNLERVEVMRGPGSSIYGNSASVAIINLITRSQMNEVQLEAGEHGARRIALGLSREQRDRGVSLFFEGIGDDGQRYTDLFERYDQTTTSQDPNQAYTLHLKGRYQDFSASLFHTRMKQEDFYLFGDLGNGDNYDESATSILSLGYNPVLSDSLKASFDLGYRRFEDEAQSLGGVFSPAPNLVIGPYFTHQILSFNSHFAWDMNDTHTWSAGLAYEKSDSPDAFVMSNYDVRQQPPLYLGASTVLDDPDFRFITDVTRTNRGLFMQDEISGHNWKLTLGGRYDSYNDSSNRFSPKVSAIYWLDTSQQLKFHYGEAFQAPVMSRMYNDNNPQTLGNPELQPAVVKTFDLGFSRFSDRYAASINLYHSETEDIVMAVPTELEGQLQFRNVGSQRTTGAELESTLPLSDQATLRMNYQHILANDFSSSQPLDTASPEEYVAKRVGSFDFNYHWNRWNFNLSGFLHSGNPVLPEQDTVAVFDTKIQYRYSPKLSAHFKIKNLLDTDWDSPAPGTGLGSEGDTVIRATPNRNRWFYAGLNYQF
ncbi:MAG: hypothetical protein C0631_14845 [Sedimenticola sp.]|nr:MAG: hypothetical protein C0631_14845 [Sedimenticola sp.]